uniref:Uncharacterized protein n=1 Tax=Tetranychus urticae TaxID=32264 RepID=T1KGD1_TETUR
MESQVIYWQKNQHPLGLTIATEFR